MPPALKAVLCTLRVLVDPLSGKRSCKVSGVVYRTVCSLVALALLLVGWLL